MPPYVLYGVKYIDLVPLALTLNRMGTSWEQARDIRGWHDQACAGAVCAHAGHQLFNHVRTPVRGSVCVREREKERTRERERERERESVCVCVVRMSVCKQFLCTQCHSSHGHGHTNHAHYRV